MSQFNRKNWTCQDDQMLIEAVQLYGRKWLKIAEVLQNDRNASQCSQRWKRISNDKTQIRWTEEEDQIVLELRHNKKLDWKQVQSFLPNRSRKQIRERFINKLNPNLDQSAFTAQEDQTIWEFIEQFGMKWTQIEKLLQGRSPNMIKNRYHNYIRKTYGNQQNPYYVKHSTESIPQSSISQLCYCGDDYDQFFNL